MGRRNTKRLYSIRKLQIAMICFFIVPVLTLQIIQNLYSFREFRTEMEQNGKSTIYLYQHQLDNDVSRIAISISNYWAQEYNHGRLLYPQNQLNAYKYSYEVLSEYRTLMNIEPTIAAMFLISGQNRMVKGSFATTFTTYEERLDMWAYVRGLAKNWGKNKPRVWTPVKLGGRTFLAREFVTKDAGTVCFIDLDQTMKPQDAPYSPQDAMLLYADASGNGLTSLSVLEENGIALRPVEETSYFSGNYFIVQNYSPISGVSMVFLEDSPVSFQKMNRIWLILGLSALIMALVPSLFLLLKRWYLRPMEKMTEILQQIRTGDLDARFQEGQKVEELQQLSVSFNGMMDQVKNLKIEAYEQKLQSQYAELQYLQLQISPHFFLNTLKTLYGMAERKKVDRIQNAILMISDHVRYIFHDNRERVPLETELRHVENYIRMQQYIATHEIRLTVEADEDVKEAPIPALCIQTFVENSCKYAMMPDRELTISLEIHRLCSEEGDSIDIMVSDNGPGFPPELLEEYNGRVTFEYREEHVGILNVRQRLYLLYGDRSGFACMNREQGSMFELIIPIGEEGRIPGGARKQAGTESRKEQNEPGKELPGG